MRNGWCVYGKFNPWGIGKIVDCEANTNTLYVKYADTESPHSWDPRYVKFFEDLKDAMDYYIKRTNESRKDVLESLAWNFPYDYTEMTKSWTRKDFGNAFEL